MSKYKKILIILILFLFSLLICIDALSAPFWGGADMWSNLLPVLHYRQSIITEHTFPWYTTLWYGGRYQWQNPLWSFLYIPATAIWLIFPLGLATKIVIFGHVFLILCSGWVLSGLFLDRPVLRISAAIIFGAPIATALIPGHIEMIMSWPWVLAGIYFLMNTKYTPTRRGLLAGFCVGIVALTGANYYVFYMMILLGLLLISFLDGKIVSGFFKGSLIGLLHLPSVWFLIGRTRADPLSSISQYKTTFLGLFNGLFLGIGNINWESSAVIGLPFLCLFFYFLYVHIRNHVNHIVDDNNRQKICLLIAILCFSLLATGVLYLGQHFLDTFRIQVRAIVFAALSIILYVFYSIQPNIRTTVLSGRNFFFSGMIILAAFQAGMTWWLRRPMGTEYQINNSGAKELAIFLKSRGAESVWFSYNELDDGIIDDALTEEGIALPNVYYGDMNQSVPIIGHYCGFSFDYLIQEKSVFQEKSIILRSDVDPRPLLGKIPMDQVIFLNTFNVVGKQYNVYKVICSPSYSELIK